MAVDHWSYLFLGVTVLGIILTVTGVIFYNVYVNTPTSQSWWIWTLISVGGFMAVVGSLISISLSSRSSTKFEISPV